MLLGPSAWIKSYLVEKFAGEFAKLDEYLATRHDDSVSDHAKFRCNVLRRHLFQGRFAESTFVGLRFSFKANDTKRRPPL